MEMWLPTVIVLFCVTSLNFRAEAIKGKEPFSAEGYERSGASNLPKHADSDEIPSEWKNRDAAKMKSAQVHNDLSRASIGPDSVPGKVSENIFPVQIRLFPL